MEEFYVTLPSNVINEDFNNTIANYKTKLPKRIELTENYEVGLAEINYTFSWYNVPKKETVQIKYYDNDVEKKTVKIKGGRYDSVNDLVESINHYLDTYGKDNNFKVPKLLYHTNARKVYIELPILNNKLVFLKFSYNLCHILGFNKEKLDRNIKKILEEYKEKESQSLTLIKPTDKDILLAADYPSEICGGIHSLFVYCDIVKHSFVGDSYTQLLRMVQIPPQTKYGDQILLSYPDIHYIPLLTRDFETIEIDIKDDSNERIPFEFGRCIVKLHFRKRL